MRILAKNPVSTCHEYAQTYPQLINQSRAISMPESELLLLKSAFSFALSMADGLYRAQGVPLLNHLVRTASIVQHHGGNVSLQVVAMLHASHLVHRFTGAQRSGNRKQVDSDISKAFGGKISTLLSQYSDMSWYNAEVIKHYIADAEKLPSNVKQLLLVRLANELEDHLDMAMEYSTAERKARRTQAYGVECIQLAEKLQLQSLADQLRSCMLAPPSGVEIPKTLGFPHPQGYELQKRLWNLSYWRKSQRQLRGKLSSVLRRLLTRSPG